MGYECPVCGAEEADGEHLANHLAFTALVRGGDHEAFLDEHVPDWADRDPESLAPDVTPHATETETEPVTEPRERGGHDHEMPAVDRGGRADLSGDAASILEDARELTQAMEDSAVANPDADGDDGDGGERDAAQDAAGDGEDGGEREGEDGGEREGEQVDGSGDDGGADAGTAEAGDASGGREADSENE